MIISVNWLKKFTAIDMPIDELTERIGARLVEIEGVEDLGEKYKDVLVVKVVECRKVEDTDHLNLTKIDDGGVAKDVERDENGLIQVVCGAPNVHEGMLAAWLPPASTVPETVGTTEPFVLAAKELRGYKSNGMLASAKELDLYDDHSGIIEIDKDAAPGAHFAELYELNDYLLDVENKSLTHRPDAFGIVGFAREIAGIQGAQFHTPAWLNELTPKVSGEGEAPKVVIDDPALSDRFAAVVLTNANEAAQSPLEMQTYLSRSGVRPINAIVDITNYLMLLTGQPLHAYDYDKFLKVSGGVNEVHVRAARAGETLTLLDGRSIEMDSEDMVIAAGETAVGLAGAMGGADTEIDSSTKRILLEAATFDLYTLRAIQMRHGVFTEAITRLTKGVPAALSVPVLAEATRLLAEHAGATVASPIVDDYPGKKDTGTVRVTTEMVNSVLGTDFSADNIIAVLATVELEVEKKDGQLQVMVPYWRHDLSIPEDVIEEVGRLSGFDSITPTLAQRDFTAVRSSEFDLVRRRLRNVLVRAGANEVLTYSFVHGDMMRKVGQNPEEAYRLVNSISPELQYYRQSLTPSLLSSVHANIKQGFDHFALFELNKFHTKRHELLEEKVPRELDSLAFILTRSTSAEGAMFYEAKQYLEYIAASFGVSFVYEPLDADSDYPVTQPFEVKRSARVWSSDKTVAVGVIGEYKRGVQKAFKLPEYSAGFEIAPVSIAKLAAANDSAYQPLSKYPGVERDVCFQVADDVSYQAVYEATKQAAAGIAVEVTIEPLDLYQPEDKQTKNITLRLRFVSHKKTLTGEEVSQFMDSITKAVTAETHGKVI